MMDFTLDPTQTALRDLAREIFSDHCTHSRLKELEAGGQSFDSELWTKLRSSGITSIGTEEGGFLEQIVVLIEAGRAVAPVPLWAHLIASSGLGGDSPEPVALAIDSEFASDLDVSSHLVWARPDGVFTCEAEAVDCEPRVTTAGFREFAISPSGREEKLDADPDEVRAKAVVGLCALAVGAAERALEMTASYTSSRVQFDRPLGSFQAVQQRAADAYIDTEAMRVTLWQAGWRISEGLPSSREVAIAKFWAAEGSQRVVSAAQHLHGGMGADVDYPLHRYTLLAKWAELKLGGPSAQLAAIGEAIGT